MPAIRLATLKIQSIRLAEDFAKSEVFLRGLHELLDFYADRAQHPGQAGKPSPLLRSYQVPAPVLRQIARESAVYVPANPEQALVLCDQLWNEPVLEFRQLAISLLKEIPVAYRDEVLGRMERWALKESSFPLLGQLISQGLETMLRDEPEAVFQRVESWLETQEKPKVRMALLALQTMVGGDVFENFPLIFRLLTPLVRLAPRGLRQDVVEMLQVLARRSPQETVFFLRQNLFTLDNPDTAWLIRQVLPSFPAAQQASLRAALREAAEQKK